MVLSNVFDWIDKPGPTFAGCYGHVVGVSNEHVRVRLEGSVHGDMPQSWEDMKRWLFLPSELEHAD